MSESAPQRTTEPFPFQIWSSLPMDMWRRGWETWSSLMLDAPMRWMTGNQQLFTRGTSVWKTAPMAWWSLTTGKAATPPKPQPPESQAAPAVLPALKSARAPKAPAARKIAPATDIVDAEVVAPAPVVVAPAPEPVVVAPAPVVVAPPEVVGPVTPKAPARAKATAKPAAKQTVAKKPAEPETIQAPAKPDNLQAIKGIGPKLGAILNDLGVTTYAQIAGWSAEDIHYIESKLDFPGRVTREKWIDQAKSLMA